MHRNIKPCERYSNKIINPYLDLEKPKEFTIEEIKARMGLDKKKSAAELKYLTPSLTKPIIQRGKLKIYK